MDELRIYDHALTAEEVLDLMEQVPEDPPPPNPHAVTTFASIGARTAAGRERKPR